MSCQRCYMWLLSEINNWASVAFLRDWTRKRRKELILIPPVGRAKVLNIIAKEVKPTHPGSQPRKHFTATYRWVLHHALLFSCYKTYPMRSHKETYSSQQSDPSGHIPRRQNTHNDHNRCKTQLAYMGHP